MSPASLPGAVWDALTEYIATVDASVAPEVEAAKLYSGLSTAFGALSRALIQVAEGGPRP